MSLVQPQDLPSVGTTQYSNYLWKWRTSTSTHEIYDLEQTPGVWASTNQNIYTIQVEKSTNTWSDHGSGNPSDITLSGSAFSAVTENSDGTVSLYGNSGGTDMLLYVFTKPTTASWISTGGGTSTEEVAVLNGSWSSLADRTHVYTIGSNSPTSSTANGLYDIRITNPQTGVSNRMFQPNSIIHTFGTATPGYISVTTNDGLYELIHIGSSLNSFPITVLASMTVGRKKVFSNFW